MEQEVIEFRTKLHSQKKRVSKVTGSWGVYDALKLIRKNHWFNIGRPVTEKEFYAVVRGVNKLIAENIANGETVKFPERMGMLELTKHKCGAKLVEGKLKINYPVDWSETLKLWFNDEEARKDKTILRNETPYVYHIKYRVNGEHANYENKMFYQFTLNTFIKEAISRNIKKGKIDTIYGN